jgi:imidazole glycerol-phosphate synthase subunit HisF
VLKTRLIPVLLLKDGLLIRSQSFSIHQFIGDPVHEVVRYNEWSVDELIYLDISRGDSYELGRHDTKVKRAQGVLDLLPQIASSCFVPLTFGGRIRTVDDIRTRLALGADKITINTAAVDTPDLITRGAEMFGNQCMVVCIDARRRPDGTYEVFVDGGRRATGLDVVEWARRVEALGAGEILLQSIDRDGLASGYDHELLAPVVQAVSIPVIALGGAGEYNHFGEVAAATGVSAVAAANIFHFKEMSDRFIKREMKRMGVPIREI